MKKTVFVTVLAILLVTAMALTGCSAPAAEPSASTEASVEASAEPSVEASTEASASAEESAAEPDAQATQAVPVASTANDAVIKAAKDSGTVTVGMSIPQLANPYFVSVKNGVEAMCKEYGYQLTVVDAGYDVAKQVSDFENFMNQGVTAVIACPIDSNALVDVTQKMNEQGILVISFAQLVPNANAIFTLDEYTYGTVIGSNAAKWINEKLDGKGNVLIISQDNVEAVVKRADGIEDTIKKECPDAVIVARQAGDNPEKGMQITEDVMQAHPEVNVITGNNDAGPLGAVEAVYGMNLDQATLDKFYIGGGDATPEAIEKMNDAASIYRATVDLGPYQTGEDCVNAIKEIVDSGKVPVNDEVKTSYFSTDPVWQEDVLAGWKPKG
ncbi:sugar ABC transporter substrate-binding protein [Christensenella intestinihominis]|uniref:sugar ABC transporter substrate-binding protein n=1 Tax=Christensenella intestinihominis TaxID=1851429 RepID=UPI00082B20F5|nr:sugar ABC transporter substrate-binding protein [Christensenella intestinihominis]